MALHALENDQEYLNLQTEFVWLQQHMQEQDQRVMILFEGRDAAGKGGAIMRFHRYLNPRHYKVVALNKPTADEVNQWYFQRYIKHFPNPGELVLFDRSWYNRAVVEPVMKFCKPDQYALFMKQVVPLEKMIVEDGIKLFKFWFSINNEEQARRLEERRTNPLQQWKLSTVDALAQQKWEDYTHFKELMFQQTASEHAPWVVINGNARDKARKEAMRFVLHTLDYHKKGETGENLLPDPEIIQVIQNKL